MLPSYFVPAVNPLYVRLIAPVPPIVAVAGALTAMLPADVLPSTQANKVKVDGLDVPKPCTQTVYVSAAGFTRSTSSDAVEPPLLPT